MTISSKSLDAIRENIKTIVLMIILDAKNGNEAAAAANWRIMTADEILSRWYDVDFTNDEFIKACNELKKAADALSDYNDEFSAALIANHDRLKEATLNRICLGCPYLNRACSGTKNPIYSGCIWKTADPETMRKFSERVAKAAENAENTQK